MAGLREVFKVNPLVPVGPAPFGSTYNPLKFHLGSPRLGTTWEIAWGGVEYHTGDFDDLLPLAFKLYIDAPNILIADMVRAGNNVSPDRPEAKEFEKLYARTLTPNNSLILEISGPNGLEYNGQPVYVTVEGTLTETRTARKLPPKGRPGW